MSAPKVGKTRVVPWTGERVEQVIGGHRDRYAAAPVLAAGCGLRQGEVFGLRVCDVDWLRGWVHVRQQIKHVDGRLGAALPKGGAQRQVPLPEMVAQALAHHLEGQHLAHGPGDASRLGVEGLMFTSPRGRPLNRSWYNRRVWKPALVEAGVIPAPKRGQAHMAARSHGMHQLRHHYASVLLDAGVSIRALAEYLGHHDPGFTLRIYAHLMPDSEDRARQAMGQVWAKTAGDG